MKDDFSPLQGLSHGPRSSVHLAQDVRSGDMVVLKTYHGQEGEREWTRESTALHHLHHPHLVRCLECGRSAEGGYVVLEWLSGGSLATLAEAQPLPLDAWQVLARQAWAGLQAIHEAGWLHRDVKPANLLRDATGRWKWIDFSQARPLAQGSEMPMTGTIHCMAPEQFQQRPLDPRTDLYALGCTLYLALTGHYAHPGETTPEIITSHLHPSPLRLRERRPDLPEPQMQWLESLLSPHPSARPTTLWEPLEKP